MGRHGERPPPPDRDRPIVAQGAYEILTEFGRSLPLEARENGGFSLKSYYRSCHEITHAGSIPSRLGVFRTARSPALLDWNHAAYYLLTKFFKKFIFSVNSKVIIMTYEKYIRFTPPKHEASSLSSAVLAAASLLAGNVAFADDEMMEAPISVGLSGHTAGYVGLASNGMDLAGNPLRGQEVFHDYKFANPGSTTLGNGTTVTAFSSLGGSSKPDNFDDQYVALSGNDYEH